MAIKVANRVANRGIVQLDQCQKAVFPIGCIEFPAPRADNSCAPVAIRRRRENAKEKGPAYLLFPRDPAGVELSVPTCLWDPKLLDWKFWRYPPGGSPIRTLGLPKAVFWG